MQARICRALVPLAFFGLVLLVVMIIPLSVAEDFIRIVTSRNTLSVVSDERGHYTVISDSATGQCWRRNSPTGNQWIESTPARTLLSAVSDQAIRP